MPVLERIGVGGVTGAGKSYQWLKMAEILLSTGVIFRCIDTDNAIDYMVDTQFPHLKPENGGNVYVLNAYEWPEYKLGVNWLQRKPGVAKQLADAGYEYLAKDAAKPLAFKDWTIVEMIDNAWSTVQRYFVGEVFQEDIGEYFLGVRREIQEGTKNKKNTGNPITDGLDGWKDWSVINKLYADFILPVVYRVRTNVYVTTGVDRVDKTEKDAELVMLYGQLGIRLSGQKKLGHQMHSLFLMIPGKDRWLITTIKDRANRGYFDKTPLSSFYMQYLVAKAKWPIIRKPVVA